MRGTARYACTAGPTAPVVGQLQCHECWQIPQAKRYAAVERIVVGAQHRQRAVATVDWQRAAEAIALKVGKLKLRAFPQVQRARKVVAPAARMQCHAIAKAVGSNQHQHHAP